MTERSPASWEAHIGTPAVWGADPKRVRARACHCPTVIALRNCRRARRDAWSAIIDALAQSDARKPPTPLLEYEAQDDASHQEARKRVGRDADPDASESFCGIRLTEDPGWQGRLHDPLLVQVIGREDRPVHHPVEPSADLPHPRQQPAEEQLLDDRRQEEDKDREREQPPCPLVEAVDAVTPVGDEMGKGALPSILRAAARLLSGPELVNAIGALHSVRQRDA